MICPQCGYEMGTKNKCIRCGYEVKTIAVVDEKEKEEHVREEQNETKVIDPCNVFLTHPYGYDGYEQDYDPDFGMGGDPIASLFDDLFGDPISDLLGGLFGINIGGSRRPTREPQQPKKGKKQGPVVEVRDVEMVESDDPDPEIIFKDIDDDPDEQKSEQKSDLDDKKHFGIKHPFKKRKK